MCAYRKPSDNYSGKLEKNDSSFSSSEQSSSSKYDFVTRPPKNLGTSSSAKLAKFCRDGGAIDALLHKTQDMRAREVKKTLFAQHSTEPYLIKERSH